jgi:hypothetical protein
MEGILNSSVPGELDTSSSESELNETVGSVSLHEDLRCIGQMQSKLRNCVPELKKNPPRTCKDTKMFLNAKHADYQANVIDYLDHIFQFNTNLMSKIDKLSEENADLKRELNSLKQTPTYAGVVSSPLTNAHLGDGPSNRTFPSLNSKPSGSDIAHPLELTKINHKMDFLEQESLANVLGIRGEAVDSLLQTASEPSAGPVGASSTATSRLKQAASLKVAICELVRPTVPEVMPDYFTSISVVGSKTKHLKVTCCSIDAKAHLLASFRRSKPHNLFANEYLTKKRSTNLYKLRLLKKRFSQIKATYSFNGVVYYKIGESSKPIPINNSDELNKLEASLLNTLTSPAV